MEFTEQKAGKLRTLAESL